MLSLEDGMLLYHGSYAPVERVDLSRCRSGRDFGRGFYLTSSYGQARNFCRLSLRKLRSEDPGRAEGMRGAVSAFRYERGEGIRFFAFEGASAEWLHFVAGNRRGTLFSAEVAALDGVDVIAGKVADDQTARTLQLYLTGAFGEPGGEEADRIATSLLLPNRLEDQFCFRTERGVGALRYAGSEACGG